MPLTLFGLWPRKVKTTPPTTVLELVIETEVDICKDVLRKENARNDRFELIIRPKSIPEVISRNETGQIKRARLWYWGIGSFWYDDRKNLWIANLSMSTNLYDEEGKFIAAGFNPEENHIATYCTLVDGQRFRFYRVMLPNSPFQFYPEVRVRIRDRKHIFLYPVFA